MILMIPFKEDHHKNKINFECTHTMVAWRGRMPWQLQSTILFSFIFLPKRTFQMPAKQVEQSHGEKKKSNTKLVIKD